MIQKPFFSIVIPTLNEEDYLPRLLTDLTKQKYHSFEVIVVDGGSADQTLIRASHYEKRLPLAILSTAKGNVSGQRNMGANHSKGEYVIFFDADVQVPQRFLYEVHRKIRETNANFLTTYIRADSLNMYDKTIARLTNMSMEVSRLIERPFVGGFNFIVSKKAFMQVGGFNESIVHSEDYDLSMRIGRAGYDLQLLRKPRLIFSLRRFRHEGRLTTLRKLAWAAIHVSTKGPITEQIFSYPMGGLWYKLKRKEQIKPQSLELVEGYVKRFLKVFLE